MAGDPCVQGGRPEDADGAHQRRLIVRDRTGHADIGRWGTQPALVQGPHHPVTAPLGNHRHLHALRVIDTHSGRHGPPGARKRLASV